MKPVENYATGGGQLRRKLATHRGGGFSAKNKYIKLFAIASIAVVAFGVPALVGFFVNVDKNTNAATTVNAIVTSTGYYARLTTNNEVDINVHAVSGGGIGYATDIVNVTANTPLGYKLYLSSEDETQALFKDGDKTSSKKIDTLGSVKVLTNNSWGYYVGGTPVDATNVASLNFNPVPKYSAPAMIKQNTTGGSAEYSENTNVTFAVKADLNVEPGSYRNKVLYSLISEGSTVDSRATVSPTTLYQDEAERGLVIYTSLMTTMDVGTVTVKVNGNKDCTGVTAGLENGMIVVRCTAPSDLFVQDTTKTYPVTVTIPKFGKTYTGSIVYKGSIKTLLGIDTMQQMTTTICANTTTPSNTASVVPEKTLTDTRDGKTYVVRKLADGNCWMVQNLDLAKETLKSGVTLDSSNSDIASGSFVLPASQTASGTAWNQTGSDNVAHVFEMNDEWYQNGITKKPSGTPDSATNKAGNYYNWYAATAGTGTASMSSGNAGNSICPKGWKLPVNDTAESGTVDKSYGKLMKTYNLIYKNTAQTADPTGHANSYAKISQYPLNFPRSGYYHWNNGALNNQGDGGWWWSSSAGSAAYAHHLEFYSGAFYPQYTNSKGNGFTVRCVAK